MTITINGTTGLSGVDGSAGTPAVQGADTNTGIFFGTDTVTIATGGTAAVTVDSGQRTKFPTTIGVGGATPSTSGSGVSFPATQSASSDANTLDDYEEGTWTPTDASGAGLTLTTQYSRYTKIGNMVYVCAEITYPSTANASRVQIGGLPFTSSATMAYGGFVRYTNSSQTIPTLLIGPSLTRIEAYQNSGSSFTNSQISLDRFDIVGMYQV